MGYRGYCCDVGTMPEPGRNAPHHTAERALKIPSTCGWMIASLVVLPFEDATVGRALFCSFSAVSVVD